MATYVVGDSVLVTWLFFGRRHWRPGLVISSFMSARDGPKYRVVVDGLGEIVCQSRELLPAGANVAYGDGRGDIWRTAIDIDGAPLERALEHG